MIGHLVASWVSYASVIGIVYAIGQKAEEFLSKEAIREVYLFSKNDPVSKTLKGMTLLISTILDTVLRFRKDRAFYTPTLRRSVTLSVIMFGLVIYPLRDFPMILIMYFGLTPAVFFSGLFSRASFDLSDVHFSDLDFGYYFFWAILFLMFICSNILSDFISFSKSRTLMAERGGPRRLPYRQHATCAA
jgi:hypothetical protein